MAARGREATAHGWAGPGSDGVDAERLEAALRARLRGEVRFDPGSRGAYATDSSSYRQVPIGVVLPRDDDDVREAVRLARKHGAPILARGGGTSLAGQCCNVALVLDFSKYMGRVLEVNAGERWARVQPGTILDHLRDAVQPHGLTFGPDPATHDRCTLGGMIGNNACGVHSVQAQLYGPGARTEDQVLELRVLTCDGEELTVGPTSEARLEAILAAGGRRAKIYAGLRDLADRHAGEIRRRFPDIPRRVSGYNLPSLLPEHGFDVAKALVGTESTCVIVLEAKLRLIPDPPERALLVLGYDDVFQAADHAPALMEHGPLGLEGIDGELVRFMRLKSLHTRELEYLPEGRAWLLAEFGGESPGEARARAQAARDALQGSDARPVDSRLYTDPGTRRKVWQVRESGLGATAFVPGMAPAWDGWEDAAVAPERLGDYLRDFRALLDRYGYSAALYGHFGQGCIHCRIDFDKETRDGLDRYLSFIDEAADLVVRYGGSLSGEHGDGQARAALLPKMYGPGLVEAFREFKAIWDPDGRMNPGKVVDAYPPDTNLAHGPAYHPPALTTRFRFPDDDHAFHKAVRRCVGVGKCRRGDGGTMCPSYMVTREEIHSTRGRARLLQEMLHGDVVTDGWRSPEVREALDLCLSCKACSSDCPVGVDMATYKAEFLSHYYEGRLRPRAAYTMGLIHWWARLARLAPRLINAAMRAPGLGRLLKAAAGIDPRRRVPAFARQTFRDWFRRRERAGKTPAAPGAGGAGQNAAPPAPDGRRRVILWPDTFNNAFHPELGRLAVDVLEAAGFRPVLPDATLCCGRPLYDFGMLTLARRQLRRVLDALQDEIRAGTPVVGLEPSCMATFRDELPGLFPDDDDARRLARQSYLLAELLREHAPGANLGRLDGQRALVHGHCHHKAVLDFDAEVALLEDLGLGCQVLDSGCCGMAGSFGFEADHYDVAQACGERVLLPALAAADPATLVVTSGFSCREMIQQNGLPRPLHLVEVLHRAMSEAGLLAGDTPTR